MHCSNHIFCPVIYSNISSVILDHTPKQDLAQE